MKTVHIQSVDLVHLAFSILHCSFDINSPGGGCSCPTCQQIRQYIDEMSKEEGAKFYNEHYPPPGGLL